MDPFQPLTDEQKRSLKPHINQLCRDTEDMEDALCVDYREEIVEDLEKAGIEVTVEQVGMEIREWYQQE